MFTFRLRPLSSRVLQPLPDLVAVQEVLLDRLLPRRVLSAERVSRRLDPRLVAVLRYVDPLQVQVEHVRFLTINSPFLIPCSSSESAFSAFSIHLSLTSKLK